MHTSFAYDGITVGHSAGASLAILSTKWENGLRTLVTVCYRRDLTALISPFED